MYAKLYSRITESSIIEEPVMTRWVFVGMLAIAEVDGTVIGTDVAIARRLNITVEEFQTALQTLMSPDSSSNNMEYDGRRVIESPNERGYFLTSYEKYRTLQTKEMRREYMKEYMANKRLNQKEVLLATPKLTESLQSLPVNPVRQGEGEADGEETKKEKRGFKKPTHKEVSDYGESIGFKVDGEHFCAYYEARGWKLSGGSSMKDWKSTVVTWKKGEEKRKNSKSQGKIRSSSEYNEALKEKGLM